MKRHFEWNILEISKLIECGKSYAQRKLYNLKIDNISIRIKNTDRNNKYNIEKRKAQNHRCKHLFEEVGKRPTNSTQRK